MATRDDVFKEICDDLRRNPVFDIDAPVTPPTGEQPDPTRTTVRFLRTVYDASIGAYLECTKGSKDWWTEDEFRRFTKTHARLILTKAAKLAGEANGGPRIPTDDQLDQAQDDVFRNVRDRYCDTLPECDPVEAKQKGVRMKLQFGPTCPTDPDPAPSGASAPA